MVVSSVLNCACTGGNGKLIAADTNLLIMLKYIWNSIIGEITINSEATKNHKAIKCDIGNTSERIDDVRKYLILVHAFGECNTTSATYEQGKLSVLKLLEKFKAASEEGHVFLLKNRTTETICQTGVRMFVILYSGKDSDSLTDLIYLKYMKTTPSSKTLKPESLPPTSRVEDTNGKYHGSARLGLEVRRCLFGASYDG